METKKLKVSFDLAMCDEISSNVIRHFILRFHVSSLQSNFAVIKNGFGSFRKCKKLLFRIFGKYNGEYMMYEYSARHKD